MASFSDSQELPPQLDILHLNEVLVLLRKCQFPDSRWFELGLALGLSKNTLDNIEKSYPRDPSRCLLECLSKWLEKADNVESKGGATRTYDSLSTAIRSMNLIAVADMLDQERCPEALALNIFNKHLPLLSKSLSDPVNVARLLYGEHVITQLKLNSVEDDSLSLSDKRQVLLAAVKDAIQADHVALQKFSIVLCNLTRNVKLGESILTDYGIYFPSDKETVLIKVQEVLSSTESSGAVSSTPKPVEVAICRSMSKEFTTLRSSYATMSCNVRKAIIDANIKLEDLKDFIISMDNKLEKKLEECQNISSTLSVIDKECSLIDIELFCAVVKNFQIEAANELIKEYRDVSNEYFQSSPIADYLKEKLKASATCPSLQCETVTYIFDWEPDEKKLNDIKDILSKTSGKLVKIEYIGTKKSISVTCSFPYHLTGVLITQLMDNLQFLKENDLKKLTIGYWIMWEREEKEEKETEQLLEEKETKISLKEEYQKEDSLEKMDNNEEQQAEAEKQLLLKHDDGSAHADLRKGMSMEIERLQHLLNTRETESKKEIEMLQEEISLLNVQLLDKEKETEVLAENIRLLKSKLHQSDHTSTDTWHEISVQVGSGHIKESVAYVGLVFYEKKEAEDLLYFTAAKDLNALLEFIDKRHSQAEVGQNIAFQFQDDDGYIELKFDAPQKKPYTGWTIEPHIEPCKLYRCDIDMFGEANYPPPCCLISVYGSPGAVPSLHYSIPLDGVADPVTLFIHRSLRTFSPPDPRSLPVLRKKKQGLDLVSIKKRLQQILTKHQVDLSQVFDLSLMSIFHEMVQVGIVSNDTEKSFEAIIKSFKVGMSFMKSSSDLESYCVKFLNALFKAGGPVAFAAETLYYEWTEASEGELLLDCLAKRTKNI